MTKAEGPKQLAYFFSERVFLISLRFAQGVKNTLEDLELDTESNRHQQNPVFELDTKNFWKT